MMNEDFSESCAHVDPEIEREAERQEIA